MYIEFFFKRLKSLHILLLTTSFFNVYSQIIDEAIFQQIKFSDIGSIFLNCSQPRDKAYSGIDTTLAYDIDEKIIVISIFEKGQNVKKLGYFNNSNKYRETNYSNGYLNGFDIKWYKNGQRKFLNYYINDTMFMPSLSWYEDGTLESVIEFKGLRCLSSISWFQNGNKHIEIQHIDTTEKGYIEKEYYENGILKSVYKANLRQQEYIYYFDNGKIACTGFIYNALWSQIGKWTEWYNNGKIKREYFFNDSIPNQKEGEWKWFDENGELSKIEKYNNGILLKDKKYSVDSFEKIQK